MYDKYIRTTLFICTVLAMGACDTVPDLGMSNGDLVSESTTRLRGQLLDIDQRPVSGAEVTLAIGSVPVTEPLTTDAEGRYTIDVPTSRVQEAWAVGQEVTVLFQSPLEDREPFGTAEGDLVHLLPATLDELIDSDQLVADEDLSAKTAFVPRQGKGFAITDELVANGGELTWASDDSQYGEGFRVSLLIEPGSIHKGDDPQEEITLTLIEQAMAPMAIPEDGFGPLWTIQPRDIEFDPPARIRIEGDRFPVLGTADLAQGERTDLFGASLETGWKLFGDIELVDEQDGRVTLQTPEGVISHGAWGHVFVNTGNDYGMLVECFNQAGTERVQCAVINDQTYQFQNPDASWEIVDLCEDPNYTPPMGADGFYGDAFMTCEQWDFGTDMHDGNFLVYGSDGESRCRSCGGSTAPYVIAMTAGENPDGSTAPVGGVIQAVALCPDEESLTDMNMVWTKISQRLLSNPNLGMVLPWDDASIAGELVTELSWRNFSKSVQLYLPDPVNCP